MDAETRDELKLMREAVQGLTAGVHALTAVAATVAEALSRDVVVTEAFEVEVPDPPPAPSGRQRRTLEEGHQLHLAQRRARRA